MRKKIMVATGSLLAIAVLGASAGDISSRKSKRTEKFIEPVKEAVDLRKLGSLVQRIDWLCSLSNDQFRLGCPGTLEGPVFPDPVNDFNSDHLPHLKVVVGLSNVSTSQPTKKGELLPLVGWKFDSSVASTSAPTPAQAGVYWSAVGDVGPFIVYQAIVENGCVGVPATVDLSLVNDALDLSNGHPGVPLGEVSLSDEIDGWGDYLWRSQLDTVDGDGTAITFSSTGFVDAFCTSDTSLSSEKAQSISDAIATNFVQSLISPNYFDMDGITISVGRDDSAVNGETVTVNCSPGSNYLCAGNFQTACDDLDGGLSTEDDGSVTCTHKSN